MSGAKRWERSGHPRPTSALRVDRGTCDFDCNRTADYLVKVENIHGDNAKFRCCESCNEENRVWADRYLPPGTEQSENANVSDGESDG